VSYLESLERGKAPAIFSQSHDALHMWFKQRLAEATGVDLDDPPMQLPELLTCLCGGVGART
jgi:hypothetical protein